MTTIIPAFTVSERSLITPANPRGYTDIGLDPSNELAPWRDTIKACGAVFLNRAFGMHATGYRTHDRNCYGREAGLTFPLGPEWGVHYGLGDLVAEWCDEGVDVIVYCGGLESTPNARPGQDMMELYEATEIMLNSSGLPDHASVVYCFDNEGEAATVDKDGKPIRTPTMYAAGALAAWPHCRKVILEPAPRIGYPSPFMTYPSVQTMEAMSLWDRQRAAIAERSLDTKLQLCTANTVFVSGNKPNDPKLFQLTTHAARIAEAKYHATSGYCSRVALATAGIGPGEFGDVCE